MVTSLPSVTQDRTVYGDSEFLCKERQKQVNIGDERNLIWEVAEHYEWVQPEIINAKSAGHGKDMLTDSSTSTKARRLKNQRASKEDTKVTKLPKQDMSRSRVTKPASLDNLSRTYQSNELSRTELPEMPSILKRARSFTEPCQLSFNEETDTAQGRLFRENLSLIYRQHKEIRKLEYDNMASKQTLREAQDLIGDLKEKIEKRNKHIRERHQKEGDIAHLVETLRRERDEKMVEYKMILKKMKEAVAMKDKSLEETEAGRTEAETRYQEKLKENTDLMRKIEAREKQIKQLKEKTEKAKKWKDNVRS